MQSMPILSGPNGPGDFEGAITIFTVNAPRVKEKIQAKVQSKLGVYAVVFSVRTSGPVAQLGARFHGMEEVKGSNPFRSTSPRTNRFKPIASALFASSGPQPFL